MNWNNSLFLCIRFIQKYNIKRKAFFETISAISRKKSIRCGNLRDVFSHFRILCVKSGIKLIANHLNLPHTKQYIKCVKVKNSLGTQKSIGAVDLQGGLKTSYLRMFCFIGFSTMMRVGY